MVIQCLMELMGGVQLLLPWPKIKNNWICFDHRRRQHQCTQTHAIRLETETLHTNSSNMMASSYCKISIFVIFLFVSSSVSPVLSSKTDNFRRANQTIRSGEELQKLKMIRDHLMKINKPSVKTIQSPDGDLIDCVVTHEQPAFDHLQLKGQKPLI